MTKEIAKKQDVADFPALTGNVTALREAIAENIGDNVISPLQLERVTIPAGGALNWTVQTLEGEITTPELVGIIIGTQKTRQYWPGTFDGGQSPPSCTSEDGKFGVGDPGGVCKQCQFNVFGSGKNGKGKACQEKKRVFLLRPGEMLPTLVLLPVMSIENVEKYLLRLTTHGTGASKVVSRATLEKDRNDDGQVYSRAVWALVGKLDAAQAEAAAAYRQAITPIFQAMPVAEDTRPEDI